MVIKGTSCYENAKAGNLVSITGDGGNAWGFYGNSYKKMAPKLYLWQYYNDNPDSLRKEKLIDWYIKEFYELRLKKLNPYDLLDSLKQKFGDEIILLCHAADYVRNLKFKNSQDFLESFIQITFQTFAKTV